MGQVPAVPQDTAYNHGCCHMQLIAPSLAAGTASGSCWQKVAASCQSPIPNHRPGHTVGYPVVTAVAAQRQVPRLLEQQHPSEAGRSAAGIAPGSRGCSLRAPGLPGVCDAMHGHGGICWQRRRPICEWAISGLRNVMYHFLVTCLGHSSAWLQQNAVFCMCGATGVPNFRWQMHSDE